MLGCSPASQPLDDIERTERVVERVSTLTNAYCSISVSGVGSRDTELDYLPHVIACENGGAGIEALKAQAIAARSVAYYNMATQGSICDGQGCQVYTCGTQPNDLHRQAVAETAQQYLTYAGMLTYGFYVAGDSNVAGPSCVDVSGSTVKYVTHNSGKTGTSVTQTKLGYVGPPGFGQNRGCMSQWGARCLESNGGNALAILRFYYGDDIQVTTAPGSCSVPSVPSTPPPSGGDPTGGDPSGGDPSGGAPTTASGSCQGVCGSSEPAPGSSPACYCDDACTGYGDCCSDLASVCGGSSSTPPPSGTGGAGGSSGTSEPSASGSCQGVCGSSSPVPGSSPACYCDASCTGYGDCCADYDWLCG